MSFKREGDDYSQLNLLKKRRISDLLAEDIPEDEAYLMRSGRYACTVCHHRPVFDTIAMLLVHRNGKKHIINVKSYYVKKQDLMKEVEKRQHILYQQGNGSSLKEVEDVAPLLTKTRRAAHHALLTAAPYKGYSGPSVKHVSNTTSADAKTFKQTQGTFFQRVCQNSPQQDPIDALDKRLNSTTQSDSLPGNRHFSSNSHSDVANGAVSSRDTKGVNSAVHKPKGHVDDKSSNCLLDDTNITEKSSNVKVQSSEAPLTIVEKRNPTSLLVKPYVPKHQRKQGFPVSRCEDHQHSLQTVTVSTKLDLNVTNESTNSQQCLNWNKESSSSKQDLNLTKVPSTFESCPNNAMHYASTIASDASCEKQAVRIAHRDLKSRRGKSLKPTTRSDIMKSSSISEDMKMINREEYLKLTSSGWKTDWKGGWVQDQDVEFDSDEDGPP